MATGTFGGYSPAIAGADYPAGPSMWTAGASWPISAPVNGQSPVYPVDLNQQLSAAVSFLSRKPQFKGAQWVSQSIPGNTQTPLTLDTEIADAWNMHSDSGDTSQVVVPTGCDGVWLVEGQVTYTAPGSGGSGNYGGAQLTYNGSTVVAGQQVRLDSGGTIQPNILDLFAASAGDYFQLQAQQVSTGAIPTATLPNQGTTNPYAQAYYPYLNCRWIGVNQSVPSGVISVPFLQGDGSWSANQNVTLTVPSPGTWTNLQQITTTQFNSDILNNVLFLSNPPFMRAIASGSPAAIATSTTSQVTGLAATLDNWGTFASNTWTCPVSGLYLVHGLVRFPSQVNVFTDICYIHATQSGVTTNYPGSMAYGYFLGATATRVLRFTAGDTVQLYTWQNSGSSLTPVTGQNSRLITVWISS